MKIAVTGSHGFIGSALVANLTGAGHEVLPIVRGEIDGEHILWNPRAGTIDSASLDAAKIDGVVHLAGAGIADKKWSPSVKNEILSSRIEGTTLLSETLAKLTNKPKIFVSGSAVGFYGSRGSELLDETSSHGKDFLAEVCVGWERSTREAQDAGIPTAHIRTGIVLDSSGGTLAKMITPFKLGLGGRIGSGKQYMSWITLHDHVRAVAFILQNQLPGEFNLVAPNPVTNEEFTKDLGAALSRPTLLPTPLFPLKLRYGKELVQALLLGSQNVQPRALMEAGFTFDHPELAQALEERV